METDDLTEMAWGVIVSASQVSDTLKAELGAMASRFKTEDEWFRGARAHLMEIFEDPAEYVDSWDLETTVNRWENAQVKPSQLAKAQFEAFCSKMIKQGKLKL